jgi:hypothetical protein
MLSHHLYLNRSRKQKWKSCLSRYLSLSFLSPLFAPLKAVPTRNAGDDGNRDEGEIARAFCVHLFILEELFVSV